MRIGFPEQLPGWQFTERCAGVFTLTAAPEPRLEAVSRVRAAAAVSIAVDAPIDVAAVVGLASVDPHTLDEDLRLSLIQAWERADAWLQANKQQALAAVVDATTGSGRRGDAARFEVGAALRLSPQTAADRTWVAAKLVEKLPATLTAMRSGDVSYWQAHSLVHALVGLTDEQITAVETRVLARAPRLSISETKRAIARAVLAVDPDGAADRANERARDRKVTRDPGYDGSATLTAFGPAAAIDTMYTALSATGLALKRARKRQALEAAANPDPDATPVDPVDLTMDACRFDALAHLCSETLADPSQPTTQHARPAVQVAIDLPTLLGLADTPGELVGHGPIPAAIARELAADADWTRLLNAPLTGELLDLGRDTYRPSAAMARFIVARDRTCRFPGCNAPASRCDLDHIEEADNGGPTVRVNLAPHCRQHHNAKTNGGWDIVREPDGTLVWTSPLGGIYRVAPTRQPGTAEPDDPPVTTGSDPPDDG